MHKPRPEDLFRAEKERAQMDKNSQHARLLAEAKAAFDKLMAEGQAARKSGRPRKHPLPPLKTTSSRLPMKPAPAPVVQVARPLPAVVTPVAKAVIKSAAPAKVTKAAKPMKTTAKRPAPARKPAKAVSKKSSAKKAKKR